MPFISQKRTIGLAKEGTPGTPAGTDLVAGDYDFRAYNITYSPEIAEFKRKYATGDISAFSSVMGKQSGTVSFSVDIAPHQTGTDNVPNWGKLFETSGWKETIVATTSVEYVPTCTQSNESATIEIVDRDEGASPVQVVITLVGAVGTVTLVVEEIGMPLRADFEYTGVLGHGETDVIVGIKDRAFGSILTPGSFLTSTPDAVLASTLTQFGSEARDVNSVTIVQGNEISMVTDPLRATGLKQAMIVNREPTMTLDPYLAPQATNDDFTRWKAGTTGAFSMSIGSGASSLTVSAPKAQIITGFDGSDRDGLVTNTMEFILTRNSDADEKVLSILQI